MSQKETRDGLVALTDLQDPIESEMLQDLLRQEKIPVMVRGDEGSGDYLKIYMGYSMFGESLYVRAADYERAKELLAGLRHNGEAALQEAQPEAFDDVEYFEQYEAENTPADPVKNRKSAQRLLLVLTLAVAVYAVLWGAGAF